MLGVDVEGEETSDARVSTSRSSTWFYDRCLYHPLRSFGWVLFRLWFRGRVIHDERPPMVGPVIFVANHTSLLDGILVHSVIRRPLRIFIAEEWAEWRPIRWLTRSMGAIRVRRDRSNQGAFEGALQALRRGDAVALFPEGGIQRSARLARFRHGAARLALTTGAPVFPCAIIGSLDAMPWPQRVPRPRRITVRCGTSLRFAPVGADPEAARHGQGAATLAIHDAVAALVARGH